MMPKKINPINPAMGYGTSSSDTSVPGGGRVSRSFATSLRVGV
jgi:hypothetical protein